MSQTNLTTVNNLVCSGNQTISGNIISTGSLQTTAITSTSINNSNSISTNSINSTNASLTNTSINILTLLSNSPIIFNYNGSNYNLSTLMLYTLNQLQGVSIASQNYVNIQISNLVNSSPDLLNTLSELATAINNDASFSTTMTNLIATKSGLSSNNIFTGSNTFGNDVSGNIISRLFSTILSINTGNTRRNVANFFECAMGATTSYIYYDNTGKFGSINTTDSTLNWNIALNSVFNINTINSVNVNSTGNGIINNLYSNILAINNNNTRRSTNDIFECCTSSTSNYLYYNNSSTFGFINTSNSASSWFINSSGSATLPSLSTPSGTITTLNSTTGTITNLYSNILAVNNNNTQRAVNDIFEVATSSTGNYLYYNNSSVFGHINTSNSSSSWSINSSGSAIFPSLNSGVSSISTLAVGSSSVRAIGDLLTVSVTSTGNYLYLNNGGVLGCYNTTGIPSNFPWTIDMVGLGTFRNISSLAGSINSLYSNILSINNGTALRAANDLFNVSISSTGNYLYYNNSSVFGHINTGNSASSWSINSSGLGSFPSLNVNGTTSIATNLCIGSSSMRTSTDKLNVSTTSTGPYMFFNDGGTLGTYDTINSTFPWFIEMSGLASFPNVNCNKLSVKNTKIKVINDDYGAIQIGVNTEQMIYLSSTDVSHFISFYPLGEDYNYNIYEFRAISTNANTVIRFRGLGGASLVDINNNNITIYNITDSTKKYFKWQYIYKFPGGDVLNRFYQLI